MPMPMIQLIYASQPFGFDEAALAGILMDTRRCNERDGITGALICRGDLYLQLLEGPQEAVEAAYQRIERDHRHLEIKLLSRRTVTERLFPAWAMRDDPARSWMWNQDEVKAGAVERATEADAVAIFERLAREPA
uniref:BLUF domain protein n=1 Tax=Rhodopseudomonas palustris (strain BisA53) TaxID=316055 RepID=Q07LL8_RHOP5